MNVVVFLGPTLPRAEAELILAADYRPPVAQGDVLAATFDNPAALLLIDGYFEQVPAVRHKEILYAMSRGIHVFGASSMGALRAAELYEFGMEGFGAIFQDFVSGKLDADDEVAIAHGTVDGGYRPSSEALVNIRATLKLATAREVIGETTALQLLAAARHCFYPDRTYARIGELAVTGGAARDEIRRFHAFLKHGRVDQKRADAVLALESVQTKLAGLAPKTVSYAFEHTDAWEALLRSRASLLPT